MRCVSVWVRCVTGEVFETTDMEAVEPFLCGAYGNNMRIGPRGRQLARDAGRINRFGQIQG